MAGEVEEPITLKAENLPTGSISFGRFELESLSWERRSSFLHNRYLEEVEKYSTPGSVTKKKEYFEAHFKKKALCQASEDNQNEAKTQHAESVISVDSFMEDLIGHGNSDVPDEHESDELQKQKMTTELSTQFSFFDNEKFTEPFNEPLNDNANSKKKVENGDASSKICKTKKKKESIEMKAHDIPVKSTVEPKTGKLQSWAHLPAPQMSKKSSSNYSSVNRELKKTDKQNLPAEMEITPKVSAIKNGNLKIMGSRNMKAKASSEIKSVEGVRAKKVEANSHAVDRRGCDVHQPVNRIKLVSKADEKQNSIVFNFKSSERAEKRKEYNLKLEKRIHAKLVEMNEIQAKTEVVKEAELKQLRKNLNFKASPMPSFYHETTTRVSDVKKAPTAPAKSQQKSIPSSPSDQGCERSCSHTISPSISSSVDDCSSSAANHDGNAEGVDARKYSVKKCENSKGEEKSKNMRRKGERKSRVRTGVRAGVVGNVAVDVAS